MLSLLLVLQVSPSNTDLPAIDFDLRDVTSESEEEGSIIVVRGRRAEDLKALRTADRLSDPLLPRAEIGFLGRSRIGVDVDQQIVGGAPSNRAMVKVKIPF
jgi:hypothetical protein